MPTVAGQRGPGRIRGQPNKRTVEVQGLLKKLKCDPITGMALIAMDESVPINIRARMYQELAQYVAPKRKAVEVTGADGGPVRGETTLTAWLEQHSGKTLGPPSERGKPET